MNKNIILLAMLFTASAIFISCDRNNDDPTPEIVLTSPDEVRNQTVYADQQPTTSGINFTTTGTWTATVSEQNTATAHTETVRSTVDWVTLSDTGGGAGSHTLTITLGTNYDGVNRTAVITIRSGGREIVITITQRGVDANNNVPVNPDNPYANLTQSQIVELLNNSLFAPAVRVKTEGGDLDKVYFLEINQVQMRKLSIRYEHDGTMMDFSFIDGLAEYRYQSGLCCCHRTDSWTEGVRSKTRETLPNNFWNNAEYYNNDIRDIFEFSEYVWTSSGRTLTGTRTTEWSANERVTRTLTVAMSENNQITRIDGLINAVEFGNEYSEEFAAVVSHDNINPTFPEGFNREDFGEEGAGNSAATIVATNVIGNTAGVVNVRAGIWDWENDWEDFVIFAQSPFQNNGFTLELTSPPNRMFRLLRNELPTGLTLSDNAARVAYAFFMGFDSAGNMVNNAFYLANFDTNSNRNLNNSCWWYYWVMGGELDLNNIQNNVAEWIYSDRNVTIRGEVRDDDNWRVIRIYNYHIDLNRGWNVVYINTTAEVVYYDGDNVVTIRNTLTSQKPSDVNLSWRVRPAWYYVTDTRSATNAGRQGLFLRGR